MPDFEEGQIVYSREGRKVRYVQPMAQGHLVRRGVTVMDDFDNEDIWFEDLEILPIVHASEPVAALGEKIKALTGELSATEEALRVKEERYRQAVLSCDELEQKLNAFQELKNLNHFIAGEMTHFVTFDDGTIEIVEKDEALSVPDSRRETRLLTLFGGSDGDLQWRLNQYKDGRGGWTDVWPCMSHEEALEIAAGMIASRVEDWRKDGNDPKLPSLRKNAQALGIDLPSDCTDALDRTQREAAERRVKDAEVHVKRSRDDLREAQTTLKELKRA